MNYNTLESLCYYVNNKISIDQLNNNNYISTENMLPNKGGKTKAAKLPNVKKTQAFIKNDILVSNIRPYFKKIWKANIIGGCSNDVLVFRANPEVSHEFLFYVLSDDSFFNYSMSTSKGTKMPRGDKNALMQYKVPNLEYNTQKKIASILSALDDKIELNNKINKNLEEMAQAIFKSWFVDFEPWGGEMPDDWEYGPLGDCIEIFDSKRVPLSNRKRSTMKKIYPYYGATKIMDYVDDYIFEGTYILLAEDGTVSNENGYPILQYTTDKFWVNNHTHVLKGKNNFNENSLYMLLKNTKVSEVITGAVQLKINQANLKSIKIIIPSKYILSKYNSFLEPIFNTIQMNKIENKNLINLRKTLLPKLMSGELDVSSLDI